MTTIEIDDDLSAAIEKRALAEHKPVKQVVRDALVRLLEECQTTQEKTVSDTEEPVSDDFFSCAGIWKDSAIDQESLRAGAWKQSRHDFV